MQNIETFFFLINMKEYTQMEINKFNKIKFCSLKKVKKIVVTVTYKEINIKKLGWSVKMCPS